MEHCLPARPTSGSLSLVPLLEVLESATSDPDAIVRLRAVDWGASYDLAELRDDAAEGFPLLLRVHTLLGELATRPPGSVVMEVEGRCLGPAFAVAAACTVECAASARLGCSEVRYGLPPLLDVTYRLLRVVPTEVALDVLFCGSVVTGDRWPSLAGHQSAHDADLSEFRPRPIVSALPPATAGVHADLLAARDLPATERLTTELKALVAALDDPLAAPGGPNETRLHSLMTRDLYRTPTARPVTVLGTGQMAATIAAATAAAGVDVTIVGRSREKAERAVAAATKALGRLQRRGPVFVDAAVCERCVRAATSVPSDTTGVVEAVAEDADIKRTVLARARESAPDAWLATTSSAIPLPELGADVTLLHFAYPAEVSPVVEVAFGSGCNASAIDAIGKHLSALGKAVAQVRSVPGYVVSRLLFAYMFQAVELCELGVPPDVIDAAAREAGFMLGPLSIIDAGGADLVLAIADRTLVPAYGERFAPPVLLRKLAEAGATGRRAGRGFFTYDTERPGSNPAAVIAAAGADPRVVDNAANIADRLKLSVAAEAGRLAEECVATPAAIDLLAITCVRFPVALGGPLASKVPEHARDEAGEN